MTTNPQHSSSRAHLTEPAWLRLALIASTFGIVGVILILPLLVVFAEAFQEGLKVYFASFQSSAALHAIRLSLTVVVISVFLNTLFGISAAWLITKFQFFGKSFLITLIDLPFAVSPVIAGMIFVLMYGKRGWLGPTLDQLDLQVIFATPGIVLATLFVTAPFVVRELIPLMSEQGCDDEIAARSLGANGWQTFWRVTLPNIRWGILYGMVLCTARAVGEFGAVSVVSGHIRGKTNTIPLHVEVLYNEYQSAAAFSIASLLALFGVITLIVKTWLDWRTKIAV